MIGIIIVVLIEAMIGYRVLVISPAPGLLLLVELGADNELVLVQLCHYRFLFQELVVVALVGGDTVLVRVLEHVQKPPLKLGAGCLGAEAVAAYATVTRLRLVEGDLLCQRRFLVVFNNLVLNVSPVEAGLAALENTRSLELLPQPPVAASFSVAVVYETQRGHQIGQVDGNLRFDASFNVLVALLLAGSETWVARSDCVDAFRAVWLGDGEGYLCS